MLVAKMKKFFCLFLSAATVLTFTACQKSKTRTVNNDAPVTLTWYNQVDTVCPDDAKVFAAVSEYAQKKINATVVIHDMTLADYSTKMPVIISSGQDYDICLAVNYAGLVSYQDEVKVGAFYQLSQQNLQKYAPESLKQIPQDVWNSAKINSSIYGFPIYKEEGAQYGYMFNTDLAKQYNLDYSKLKTWKDIGPLLESLHTQAPSAIGMNSKSIWNLASYSISAGDFGVIPVPGDKTFSGQKASTVFNPYDTQEFKDFCTTMHQWYKDGYFPQNPQAYTNTVADFTSNHLLAAEVGYTPDYEKSYSKRVGHTITFLPATPALYEGASNFQVISAKSKNPTRAMEFLNLVNSDINMGNLLRHGIEGTHYTKNGNMVTLMNSGKGYEYDFGWQWGNVFNQNWVDTYPSDITEAYKKFNSSCVSNPLVGFYFDNSSVTNQVAAVNNVMNQYYKPLSTGVMDPATGIPSFISALNQNGAKDIMQAEQKQITAFLSKNKK